MSWTSWVLAGLIAATLVAVAVYRVRVAAEARKLAVFLGEVRGEVEKVTWPDKEQLRNATLVILVFVTVVALLIGALDVVLQWLLVTLPGRG